MTRKTGAKDALDRAARRREISLVVVGSIGLDDITTPRETRENLLGVVARLVDEGYQLPHFAAQLVRAVRNMLVAKLAGPAPHLLETSPEECQRMADLAAEFSEQNLMRFLDILLGLHQQMRHASEARFTLELGLLKLVEAERLVPLEE